VDRVSADADCIRSLGAGIRHATSLLPVRWSLAIPIDAAAGTPAIPDYGMFFIYEVSAELRPPDGVAAPTCVR
jgi:hypothetical protein